MVASRLPRCLSPETCGRLHYLICTAHLAKRQRHYCSPRCRARAQRMRMEKTVCERCGHAKWVPRWRLRRSPEAQK
ncbi:hypothetical protein MYX77_11085 [Acidobacteriia bacterium AH_259_A11_L15]|nr:hypothetical protein [Acidobacteriia bacterium AH_259_A11_L15]